MKILQGAHSANEIRTKKKWRRVALLPAFLLLGLAARAQEPVTNVIGTSDLARENLSRVAASAAQITAVLGKEPGLMVELKRWVAKEATDHGQIVEDGDLTDQAVFNRLNTDVEFRSVATQLLQRYGYLIPKLNPESDLAKDRDKERDVLIQERTRRLLKAQAEEEAQEDARRTGERMQRSASCDPRRDRDCEEPQRGIPQGRRARTYPAPPPDANQPVAPEATLPLPRQLQDLPPGVIQSASERLSAAGLGAQAGRLGLQTNLGPALGGPEIVAGENRALLESREERTSASTRLPERETRSRIRSVSSSATEAEEDLSHAAMVRRPNPYADIPSLYDMYAQVSPRPPKLERFGLDVFRNGIRDSELLPMDLPVGPDYVVGPGDGLAIDLWGSVSQRLSRTVDREGRVALPEVGPVLVSGRSLGEVQGAVQQVLRTQFRDVSADVSLSRLRTIRVYVVGDVEEPGAYDISSLSTPLNALFAAGGPTSRGSLRVVRHYRGKQLVQEVDVYDLLLHGVRSDLKRLENGDTVLVPPLGPQVTVEGTVRRPAIYELRKETTLAEALELSGGILPIATLRNIQVQRVEAHQKRTMLSLDIAQAQSNEEITKQLEAFQISDGDEVRIFPIAPYNQDAIYIQGHVLRPGRYSYRAGMKLTDLISSFNDLLPEPAAKYAEIIRLNPPDYRPSVEPVDLAAALANPAVAPKLQPMDTVRIFSRYDFENPPIVSVGGEVRAPGTYRTSGQIHLSDAIHLAGGLTPDAVTGNAQVFRHLSNSKLKIFSVNLEQALAGNPIDNILLQPRDRIVVHPNLAKVDPPSVFVKGEVTKPGRYPLSTNMRVGDLIHLAGGLKRSASTDTADLTRFLSQDAKMEGEHVEIDIASALAGDPNSDIPLRDSDTLTIRQIPRWKDIGASVTIQGEVGHPGVYGIQPSERLSSILKRAGGFLATAHLQGAVFERVEVRQLQERSKQELINRIEAEAANFKVAITASAQEQATLQQAALLQRQRVVEGLKQAPVTGRLVISLKSNVDEFEKSPDNIELRDGDRLLIPKRPNFVVVTGQVYNSNAITYARRKNAAWYLKQAGGSTDLANKKAIFIVRANGSIVSGNRDGWWSGGVLSAPMFPGDTIVVPEKPIGGGPFWKNFLSVAQLAQSAAISVAVATR